jgi:hypothetical protein
LAKQKVTELYQRVLGRAPDPEGLKYWSGQLENGATVDQIKAAMDASTEGQQKAPMMDYVNPRVDYAQTVLQNQYDSQLQAIKQAQAKALMGAAQQRSAVDLGYNKALNQLNEQKTQTMPTFQARRDTADVNTAQNVNRLREIMAHRGLLPGGQAVTAEAGLMSQGQAVKAQADTDQANFVTAMNNRLAEVEAGRADAIRNIEQNIAMLIAQGGEQEQQLAKWLAGELAAAQQRAMLDYQDYAERRGDIEWERDYRTERDRIGDERYQTEWDYQVDRDRVGDERFEREWDYRIDRDRIGDERYQAELEYGKERDRIGDERYQNEWDYQVGRDKIYDEKWQAEFDLSKGKGVKPSDQEIFTSAYSYFDQVPDEQKMQWVEDNRGDLMANGLYKDFLNMAGEAEQKVIAQRNKTLVFNMLVGSGMNPTEAAMVVSDPEKVQEILDYYSGKKKDEKK